MATTSPERFSFPLIGNCVGCENCVEAMPLIGAGSVRTTRTANKPRRVEKTEHPPPIPLLARTGNLHARMPWVLRRHYTADGRLILREERVRNHEYFRAHRSGGRFTLQLVRVEDNAFELPIVNQDGYENDVSNSLLQSEEDVSNSLMQSDKDVSKSLLQSEEDVSNSLIDSNEDVSNNLLHSKEDVSDSFGDVSISLLHSKEDVSSLHSKEDTSNGLLHSKEDVSNSLVNSEENVSNSLLQSMEDVSSSLIDSNEDVSNSLLHSKEDVSDSFRDVSISLLHSKEDVSDSLLQPMEDVSNSFLHSKEDISDSFLRSKEDIYHEEEEQKDDDKEQRWLVSETESTVGSGSGIGGIRGSGEWKCLYKTVSPSSSCIFGVPVHSLGPVLG